MMKRTVLIILMSVVIMSAQAQRRGHFDPDKFKEDMRNYIKEQVYLTPQEESRFFPLFDEMHNKQRMLFEQMKNYRRQKPVDNVSSAKAIQEIDRLEIEIRQLRKAYHKKFMRVIPAKKVFAIIKAEDRFHKRTFKKVAGRRR